MNPITITCPKCKEIVSIDEALSHQLEDNIRKQVEEEQEEELKKVREQTEEETKRKYWKIAQEKAEEKLKIQTQESEKILKQELDKKDEELKQAREGELKLRKEKQAMEEEKEKWELEKQRQLDEEREKIKQKTAESMLEEHRMRDLEKNKQMEDMRKKIDELQMKVNLTSQQLQGEVLELELEELLKREFPLDDILPVGKGVKGADVVQLIHDQSGAECGKIIWESKRTKNWEEGWIIKLKEDMRNEKADMAIIVSTALPQGMKNFALREGVYVTSFECITSVAGVIRMHLIKLHSTKLMSVGKNERIESLYNYITSSEFAQKIDAMLETYTSMLGTLEKERTAMLKIWAQREKEIKVLKDSTVMIHGSLTGLIGDKMGEVKSLEFPDFPDSQPLLFEEGKVIES